MIIEKELKVNNELGLHARPATHLVKIANKFDSNIFLYKSDDKTKKADCKSILSVLLLGATNGTNLILTGNGPDISEAIKEISSFFENKFEHI
jgi:phosphotransferase system HPr (HPr) family protein